MKRLTMQNRKIISFIKYATMKIPQIAVGLFMIVSVSISWFIIRIINIDMTEFRLIASYWWFIVSLVIAYVGYFLIKKGIDKPKKRYNKNFKNKIRWKL